RVLRPCLFGRLQSVTEGGATVTCGIEMVRQRRNRVRRVLLEPGGGPAMQVAATVAAEPFQNDRANPIVDENAHSAVRTAPDEPSLPCDIQRGDSVGRSQLHQGCGNVQREFLAEN